LKPDCGRCSPIETGLRPLLTDLGIELVSGPGCPVCVTAQADLDHVFAISDRPDVSLCTFGDMLRVPGSAGSLEQLRAGGADIRVIYSPLDSLRIAADEPEHQVVLLAVGFETTVPAIACTAREALERQLANYHIFDLHKTIPAALASLAANAELQLDGFICPGHVSVIIGAQAYRPIAEQHGKPCAITGFEPVDILRGVLSLAQQIRGGQAVVENVYARVVREQGNPVAQQAIAAVFEPASAVWRGLGSIPHSGLRLREEFQQLDARRLAPDFEAPPPDPRLGACRCGDVLLGKIHPPQCGCFGTSCTPQDPLGACMVSQEGACRAYFRYDGAS
jgi:hydrogenase expression/formation protein HypD